MLVIARRRGQAIRIDGEISVVVTELSRTTVKLAIAAPRGRSIVREEIWRAIEEENRRAAESVAEGGFGPAPLSSLSPASLVAVGSPRAAPAVLPGPQEGRDVPRSATTAPPAEAAAP
ncbi:MAG: carbon storage regulator [Polyangiaceae bacterium]|nr:carbon storage regulator [Polyangiaceae bacterium]